MMSVDAIIQFVGNNIPAIGIATVVGVLLFWALQESRDADGDYTQAAVNTGMKARKWSGGIVGVLGALLYAVVGVIFQTGMSLAQFGDLVADIIVQAPMMFAGFGVTLLGALGLEGVVPVSALVFGAVAATVFGFATLVKRRRELRGGSTR